MDLAASEADPRAKVPTGPSPQSWPTIKGRLPSRGTGRDAIASIFATARLPAIADGRDEEVAASAPSGVRVTCTPSPGAVAPGFRREARGGKRRAKQFVWANTERKPSSPQQFSDLSRSVGNSIGWLGRCDRGQQGQHCTTWIHRCCRPGDAAGKAPETCTQPVEAIHAFIMSIGN